ncbi:conserved hypothetical protein [Solidesulfovibrio fructosivorans JJ]]|uniref:Uncharacterized protein n=1 Tax=Solidesulfovibrio fructosivorans JJ] TaxID=596151 RepID=E1JTQ5_SOLFR|nr:hypothetical protein [Solidesulfovibrio fructosivorans]EFL52184.1 conserved hypothetical protein [Solidesulfovibrio fructosivorans JJ]]
MKKSRRGAAYLFSLHPILTVSVLGLSLLVAARSVPARQARQGDGAGVASVCGRTDTYGCYTNQKYGYVIAWPKKLLTGQGEADAGDGQVFRAPDGQAELRCWARWNSLEPDSMKTLFERAQREEGLHVTYKRLGKKFFVVSGTKGDVIVYQKTIKSGQITATFVMTYATSRSGVFNPIVGDIAKSFVANPESMAR